jgi:hypothetical protein
VLAGPSQEVHYSFDIPESWRLAQGAYLDLRFRHSQLLNYARSFLRVSFNGEPIATIALTDESALNGELRVELPPSAAHPRRHDQVSIQSTTRPNDPCAGLDTWLVVSSASRLHLDHEEQDAPIVDLNLYPHPFDRRSDLADVLFVLPSEPRPGEWEGGLQLAAALGSAAGGPDLAPIVATALGDTWSELELADYHIVAVGRPLRNDVLQQVNDQLPQPFRPDSDGIEQRIDDVIFRLPPGISLGLVQLLPSPWNEDRAFLAVAGTTDAGVEQAVDLVANRYWSLEGNLVLIRDGEVSRVDTRRLTGSGRATAIATAVSEMTMVDVATATTASEMAAVGAATATAVPAYSNQTPGVSDADARGHPWVIPLIGVTGVIVIAILFIAFRQAQRGRL